jgi:hypothetical protein
MKVGSGGRALAGLLGLLVVVLVGLPVLSPPDEVRRSFASGSWQALSRHPPDFVFIGNSMLYTRLDRQLLAEGLEGSVVFLTGGGAMSAQWYLSLKNLLEAGVRPRHVVVLFRDDFLTRPRLRTTGRFRRQIERLSNGDDPLLESLLAPRRPDAGHRLGRWLPSRAVREATEAAVDRMADRVARPLLPQATAAQRKQVVNAVFGVERMRGDLQLEALGLEPERDTLGFAQRVERSFLPAMLELAADARVPLTFVRVQRRRRLEKGADPPELERYLVALRGFVEKHGASLVDMNGRPELGAGLYGEGDHIAREHRARYTRLFVSLHGERLRGGAP